MKKIGHLIFVFSFVCSCLMLFTLTAFAETNGIFTYAVSGDSATITSIDFSGQTEIHVPETLDGYTVTAIESQAMTDSTWILGDDTVQAIYLPKTISAINYDSFSFADLARIEVDADNPYFSSDAYGVLFNKDKTTLVKAPPCLASASYTVPDGVTTLEKYAFENDVYLQTLSLPDTLTSFGQQAFFGMQELRSITLPEGITSIGQNDFACCVHLASVALPSTLKEIKSSAFTECPALKEIIIPEGVTSIGKYAFESDSSLERAVLPASLRSVGQASFGNCPQLEHVYYAGTAEDWSALHVQTGTYAGSRVDAFDTAMFHYNFDVAPYATLQVEYNNDLLTISGSGRIPADADSFQFWDEHKDTVTALFLAGNIETIDSYAFTDFPNLTYVIFDTEDTRLLANAFSACPKLATILVFGRASFTDTAVDSDADYFQIFYPESKMPGGDFDPARYHTIPFSYADNALLFNGSVTWDSYQFLDTMTAFSLHFDPIDVLKCKDFTFNALPLYGTDKNGDYAAIEDNRLVDAELRAQIDDTASISFNDLINGIIDGSITNFRLVAKDSEHEEIKDTPIEIKDENDNSFGGFIRKAIKWIVRLLDALLNIVSKLRR